MKVSLSTHVAFWRNLLCCLADCPSFTLTFLKLIFPLSSLSHFNLSQVSLLSLAISLLQFYALITMCYSGVTTFSSSLTYLSSLRRFQLSSEEMRRAVQAKISKRASELNTKKLRSLNIITENIAEAVRSTILNGIVGGVAEFCIGIAFFWLGFNSLRFTDLNTFGGLKAVINALALAELGLVPFLYLMFKDVKKSLSTRSAVLSLSALLSSKKIEESEISSIEYFDLIAGIEAASSNSSSSSLTWMPIWSDSNSLSTQLEEIDADDSTIMKFIEIEIEAVDYLISQVVESVAAKAKAKAKASKKKKSTKPSDDLVGSILNFLRSDKLKSKLQVDTVLSLVFLVLNIIAFHGYSLAVYTYYVPESDDEPVGGRMLKYGNMSHDEANDWGNFAGDFCWTLEPLIIINRGKIVDWVESRLGARSKMKQD